MSYQSAAEILYDYGILEHWDCGKECHARDNEYKAIEAVDKLIAKRRDQAFLQGRQEGIRDYAWMKDGVTYVGTTGTTLKQAIERLTKESE